MSGLLLFFFIGLWLVIAVALGMRTPKWLGIKWCPKVFAIVFALLIFVAPVGDEIIGKYQFHQLCERYAKVRATKLNQSYQNLKPVASASFKIIGSINPTSVDVISFGEPKGEGIVRSITSVTQTDGWILRWLGFAATSSCGAWDVFELPPNEQEAIRNFQYPERRKSEISESELARSLTSFYPKNMDDKK